jgi:hypothetical protein
MTAKKEYSLTPPADARCMVVEDDEHCQLPVAGVLNLRLRTLDTGAVYGPNIPKAWLCDKHLRGGAEIFLDFRPLRDGHIEMVVRNDGRLVGIFNRPIKRQDEQLFELDDPVASRKA